MYLEIIGDHANNYVNVQGVFPNDKVRMLSQVAVFLQQPQSERDRHYDGIGSRI